jgi:hypothetical protein
VHVVIAKDGKGSRANVATAFPEVQGPGPQRDMHGRCMRPRRNVPRTPQQGAIGCIHSGRVDRTVFAHAGESLAALAFLD